MHTLLEPSSSPFGEPDSESELERLQAEFSEHYFEETAFNRPALSPKTYLIVGRRGSGKTALNHYFEFQQEIANCRAIDINEPEVFDQVIRSVNKMPEATRDVRLNGIAKVWEYLLWNLVFGELYEHHEDIQAAYKGNGQKRQVLKLWRKLLEIVTAHFLGKENREVIECMEDLFMEPRYEAAREACLEVARENPVIVSVDSLEQYDIRNETLMDVVAGLMQAATRFNGSYSPRGIHVKVFVSGEVYPFIFQTTVVNPLKYAKRPVYLVWRNKDLLRLISWKFYKFLCEVDQLPDAARSKIKWKNYRDVYSSIWEPCFGEFVENELGRRERTFPYLTRHTHMRPRQMIVLCNEIARHAIRQKHFPHFSAEDIRHGLQRAELDLANEVINSYISIYPRADEILDVLTGIDSMFCANELDRRAPISKPYWMPGEYSPRAFVRFLTQLGIVGSVRQESEGHVSVDFEYSMRKPLAIDSQDSCAIHPMFYQRINAKPVSNQIVHPFKPQEEAEPHDSIFMERPGKK